MDEAAQQLRSILDALGDAVIATDLAGGVRHLNRRAEELTGWSLDQARGRSLSQLVPALEDPQDTEMQTVLVSQEGVEYSLADSPELYDAEGRVTGRLWVFRPQPSQEALRTSQAQLSNALKVAKLGYWEYDLEADLFTFNDQFYALFRTTAEEVGGYTMRSQEYAERFVHPEDVAVVGREIEKVINATSEFSRQLEHRIVYADGEVGHIVVRFFIIQDRNGRTIRTYGANQDVTEAKRAQQERARLEAQVRRSQKLETIGTLTGGIAHDFNNLLTPIMGYAELALARLEKGDPLRDDLAEIFMASQRARDLVSQILTFSRKAEQQRRPLYLQGVLEEALRLLRPSIPSTIRIEQRIDSGCPHLLGDVAQMHQLIVNLCTNAAHAMIEGGTLTLELRQVAVGEKEAKFLPHLTAGDYVRLRVSDTGCGMEEEVLDRIFEPFFTTKGVGEGSGLGLSVVHGIVRGHRGEVVVRSEPGRGSVFDVYFPAESGEFDEAGTATGESLLHGEGSILLVEDEAAVAAVVGQMLERLGYRVDVRTMAREALEQLRRDPRAYDLVLTDLTMPEMTGLELARQVHELRADLPVILMTGHGSGAAVTAQGYGGIREVVGKPVRARDLGLVIRRTLAGTASSPPPLQP